MDTVFDVFDTVPYIFLRIARGKVKGNVIVEEYSADGVFKSRRGMTTSGNQENRQATSTLHIRPDEAFIADINSGSGGAEGIFTGHGVRVNGQDYEIIGDTSGMGGDSFNELEHYTLKLQAAKFVALDS